MATNTLLDITHLNSAVVDLDIINYKAIALLEETGILQPTERQIELAERVIQKCLSKKLSKAPKNH